MEYKPGRIVSYRFTVDLNDENDKVCLKNLKDAVKMQNDFSKNYNLNNFFKVIVRYRKPKHNHPLYPQLKYAPGGSVRKEQKPQFADVYVRQL